MLTFDELKREPLLQEASHLENIKFRKEKYIERDAQDFLAIPRPAYVDMEGLSWGWCFQTLELLMELYSAGAPIDSLHPYAEHMLSQFQRHQRAYPEFSLKIWEPDAYQFALWLLAIAVLFNLPERIGQIAGHISVNPENGQDLLLRHLFARTGTHLPGEQLMHEKPYSHLLTALNTHTEDQQQALRTYLKTWYRGMRHCYWHDRHKRRPDAGFFGYWALEAGMVTLLWDIDDTPYRDLPYYPRDLVDHARAHGAARSFPQPEIC